jgi:hypothetical protein
VEQCDTHQLHLKMVSQALPILRSAAAFLILGANGVFALEPWTPMAYSSPVARRFITVAETPLFNRQARESLGRRRAGGIHRAKARQENLTAEEKKAVRKLAAILKS